MKQLGGLLARVLFLFSPHLVGVVPAGFVRHRDSWTTLKTRPSSATGISAGPPSRV